MENSNKMSEVKYYYAKKSASKVIFRLCVIAVIFTILLFVVYGNIPDMPYGIIFFWGIYILITGYAILYAYRNKPTLIIDEEGLIDNASFNGLGRIAWAEIRQIELKQGINMRFLCIHLFDQKKKLEEMNSFKRIILKTNLKKLGTICTIPEISINADLEEIIQEMDSYLKPDKIQR